MADDESDYQVNPGPAAAAHSLQEGTVQAGSPRQTAPLGGRTRVLVSADHRISSTAPADLPPGRAC
jgi:hypothetical protein